MFWTIALLSIMLGVMNLLPIPALDGGHVVLLYEIVSGKKPAINSREHKWLVLFYLSHYYYLQTETFTRQCRK
jgi:regulator of sigma E protease